MKNLTKILAVINEMQNEVTMLKIDRKDKAIHNAFSSRDDKETSYTIVLKFNDT